MSLRDWLEPEEKIGRIWHRLVGAAASYPFHPGAAVDLESQRRALGVFFRGAGGAGGLELVPAGAAASGHRLALRQRVGLDRERLGLVERTAERVLLPLRIGLFPDPALNRSLYFWQTAYLAVCEPEREGVAGDPLQADLAFLRRAHEATRRVLGRLPGMRDGHARLCRELRAIRPARRLPSVEAAVEEVIDALLGGPAPAAGPAGEMYAAVTGDESAIERFRAPHAYRTFLPVPLWGRATERRDDGASDEDDGDDEADGEDRSEDSRTRRARRRDMDQARRRDPLVINRFEKIMSWAEMVNLNRARDDADEEEARRAAEDMDELTLSRTRERSSSRLRLDLDLAPRDAEVGALHAPLTYPEWDYRRSRLHPDHCAVYAATAQEEGEQWHPDEAARRRIRRVRRQFEALRPRRELFRRQLDGAELDMDAVVRSRCDLVACGEGSDRIYATYANASRDLAVALLVDVSLSTDGWVNNRRVLDVEKEALTALAYGLSACTDPYAIYTFTSRRRRYVRVDTVKDFDERLDGPVLRRIAALRPGYYTRMGAAVRHVHSRLAERTERHRLLVMLTDGKPNDVDYYEGRYGVEDTRRAIREARADDLSVFGITVDRQAQDYFPYLFGKGGYAIVGRIERLPRALPELYRQLVS